MKITESRFHEIKTKFSELISKSVTTKIKNDTVTVQFRDLYDGNLNLVVEDYETDNPILAAMYDAQHDIGLDQFVREYFDANNDPSVDEFYKLLLELEEIAGDLALALLIQRVEPEDYYENDYDLTRLASYSYEIFIKEYYNKLVV